MPGIRWLSVVIALALVGCGPDDAAKERKGPEAEKKETLGPEEQKKLSDYLIHLMDSTRDDHSYVQDLSNRLKLKDGFLIVETGPISGISLLPPNTSWSVSCGITGILVTFGNAVSVDSDSGGVSAATITLAIGRIKKERCQSLAPALGGEIVKILSEQK